ncbi:MAG: LacI family DNA-binding transcriptional regulator [Chthoniobacterales bacterium]
MLRAKLVDVAREAKVAVSTASIVLSEARQLNEIAVATQERIRRVAHRLKYRANANARQIHMRGTGSVALLQSSTIDRAVLSNEFLYGISMELQERNQSLRFIQLDDEDLMQSEPGFLRQRDVDGVIVNYGVEMPQGLFDFIRHYEIPSVFVNTRNKFSDSIWFDHLRATKRAVQRLADLGHRRIAYLFYTGKYNHYSFKDTLKGYMTAITKLGLKPMVVDSLVQRPERLLAAKRLLEGKRAPTAILAASVSSANPLIQAAGQLGLRIPGDLSICTFGNQEDTSLIIPQPSYISLPWRKAGRIVVQMLLDKIEKKPSRHRSRLECEWQDGGDTIGPL